MCHARLSVHGCRFLWRSCHKIGASAINILPRRTPPPAKSSYREPWSAPGQQIIQPPPVLEWSSWPSFLELSVVAVVGIVIILTGSWVGQNKSAHPLMVARHVCDCPGKCVRTLGEHVDEKHVQLHCVWLSCEVQADSGRSRWRESCASATQEVDPILRSHNATILPVTRTTYACIYVVYRTNPECMYVRVTNQSDSKHALVDV